MSDNTTKKIVISVPETYKKVSDDVWKEFEDFLFTGFLTATSIVKKHHFVFKTINQNEIKLISYAKPVRSSKFESDTSFRIRLIAHSVFMINGVNVLYERPNHIDKIIRIIGTLSPVEQNRIIDNLSYLNERSNRLFPLTEVYTYENRSRFKWLHIIGSPINSHLNTGVPGTDHLGLTSTQQMWVSLNHIVDTKEEVERDWANAKFVGSCMAGGKAIKSIDEKDKGRINKEKQEREELKMKVLYRYLNKIDKEGEEYESKIYLPDGRLATVVNKFKAETAEELAEQLSSALSGEKDYHDMVMDQKMKEMEGRSKEIDSQKHKLFSLNLESQDGSRSIGNSQAAKEYMERINRLKEIKRENFNKSLADLSNPETFDKT